MGNPCESRSRIGQGKGACPKTSEGSGDRCINRLRLTRLPRGSRVSLAPDRRPLSLAHQLVAGRPRSQGSPLRSDETRKDRAPLTAPGVRAEPESSYEGKGAN